MLKVEESKLFFVGTKKQRLSPDACLGMML
jgi:hypothetical protein